METRRYRYVVLCLTLLLALPIARAYGAAPSSPVAKADAEQATPDKVAVLDGHVVHDVGRIWSHVSNWGLIGSEPGATTSYSDAPSAMWPIYSGNEYLWAAGLWVGATVSGQPRVTTGAHGGEFLPTESLGDTIYTAAFGTPGGNRYPWDSADDDGDGREDEDLPNGLDDDGDVLVDEDFAAFGDQQFVSTYNDLEPALQVSHPDHVPLGVRVVQRSIQWSSPLAEDFIGFDFTITNVGATLLEQVYLGLFSDCDIGPRGLPISGDDYAGYVSTTAPASDGTTVPVRIAYMYDGAVNSHVDGYVGWVLCGHTTDPQGLSAPSEPGVTGFQRFEGNASFASGGDPTNDAERYQMLSAPEQDPDVPPNRRADYRTLMSSGPFTALVPGQSLSYQVALVLGAGLDEMIAHAAEAVAAYRGVAYDRDGDPANGAEFDVHWLRAEDAPVAACSGRIVAGTGSGGVDLLIESNSVAVPGLVVVRQSGTGVPERQWSGEELESLGVAGHACRFRLRDPDSVDWPRTYVLAYKGAEGLLTLDQVLLERPSAAASALRAAPNPFNPRTTLRFNLPQAGMVRLAVYDVAGRLVRVLIDESMFQGGHEAVWNGRDASGREIGSGTYLARLEFSDRVELVRLELVR